MLGVKEAGRNLQRRFADDADAERQQDGVDETGGVGSECATF